MPITLSGKKCALNKVYALDKQVSKCTVMAFFSNNTSILSFVLTGYRFPLTMHVLCAFSVTRPDYKRGDQYCMVLKSHVPGSNFVFL